MPAASTCRSVRTLFGRFVMVPPAVAARPVLRNGGLRAQPLGRIRLTSMLALDTDGPDRDVASLRAVLATFMALLGPLSRWMARRMPDLVPVVMPFMVLILVDAMVFDMTMLGLAHHDGSCRLDHHHTRPRLVVGLIVGLALDIDILTVIRPRAVVRGLMVGLVDIPRTGAAGQRDHGQAQPDHSLHALTTPGVEPASFIQDAPKVGPVSPAMLRSWRVLGASWFRNNNPTLHARNSRLIPRPGCAGTRRSCRCS